MPWGADLARLRREQGLTQREIATSTGISVSAISRYERGEWGRDNLLLLAYAYAIGIPFDIEILPIDPEAKSR